MAIPPSLSYRSNRAVVPTGQPGRVIPPGSSAGELSVRDGHLGLAVDPGEGQLVAAAVGAGAEAFTVLEAGSR